MISRRGGVSVPSNGVGLRRQKIFELDVCAKAILGILHISMLV